jgi:hypothetical protein
VSDIFAEVEEDLRAERVKQIFQRYGGLMVVAAVLVVLGTAGWKGWSWYQARETARAATTYIGAMEAADGPAGPARAAAVPELEKLAAQGGGGYPALARLQLAPLRFEAGAKDAALTLWDQVAADTSADPVLRDAARLQWALHQIDAGEPSQVMAHLQPLMDPANPFHSLAEEAQALLVLRQNKKDEARAIFKRLSQDVTAPQGVRGRAAGLLAQLGE